jgi:recombinational DNA repair protein (RecF pathway)
MGVCSNCKKKIEYNHFKRYRGKILCYACYDTRLERKAQKKAELETKSKILAEKTKVEDDGKVELKYELTDDEEPKKKKSKMTPQYLPDSIENTEE